MLAEVLVYCTTFLFCIRKEIPEKDDSVAMESLPYYKVRDSIWHDKDSLKKCYYNCSANAEKDAILQKASLLFYTDMKDKLFPYWYGTPWAYYGYGERPQVDYIACGYFVAVLLRDIGAKVSIPQLAEGTSGSMIERVTSKKYISTYWNMDADTFYSKIKSAGDALYIVGLDNHTGYLLCENSSLYFIDSSPEGVLKRDPASNSLIHFSSIRMVGCISKDPGFLQKWLCDVEMK